MGSPTVLVRVLAWFVAVAVVGGGLVLWGGGDGRLLLGLALGLIGGWAAAAAFTPPRPVPASLPRGAGAPEGRVRRLPEGAGSRPALDPTPAAAQWGRLQTDAAAPVPEGTASDTPRPAPAAPNTSPSAGPDGWERGTPATVPPAAEILAPPAAVAAEPGSSAIAGHGEPASPAASAEASLQDPAPPPAASAPPPAALPDAPGAASPSEAAGPLAAAAAAAPPREAPPSPPRPPATLAPSPLPGVRRLEDLAERQRDGMAELRRDIRGVIQRLEAEEPPGPRRRRPRR